MKVFIGKYKDNWISPYTIKQLFFGWRRDYDAYAKQPPKWLMRACEGWLAIADKLNPRVEYIHIDNYDVWGMDTTLAQIILPMLKKLKQQKQGAPHVDDEDVPYGLRSFNDPNKQEHDLDKFYFERYNWVLDELIWTFTALLEDYEGNYYFDIDVGIRWDKSGYNAFHERVNNGLRLFGKYYRSLWD